MFQVIIAFVTLVLSVSLFGSFHTAVLSHRNIILGVLLPLEQHKNPEVLSIVNKYRRNNILLFILSLVTAIPVVFLPYVSFVLFYMIVWFIAYMAAVNHNFNSGFSKLLLLKSENKWFPETFEFRTLTSDSDKNKKNHLFKFVRRLIPSTKKKLLKNTEQPIYVDEDENWINGYYYNPEDKRINVEKRTGYGTTINMATKGGKAIAIGGAIFITALLVTLLVLFIKMDFATFEIDISGETVEIKAPVYGYEFDIKDVEEITLSQTLPEHGSRTNGAATETYLLGNFHFDEIGKAKMYIYRGYPPYLVIKLKDRTIFFNTKSKEETEKYYELMTKMKDKK